MKIGKDCRNSSPSHQCLKAVTEMLET